MNIFTYNSLNFGDGVNKTFWKTLTAKEINFNPTNEHYITTGSIMLLVQNNSIIFGTGFISKDADLGKPSSGPCWDSKNNNKYAIPINIIAVRGPLSREKMLRFGIKCPENYGDPLILMPCIYNKKTIITDNIIGIIPHYIDKNDSNFKLLKKNLENKGYNIKTIDIEVGDNYKKLIDEINSCKYIISSSLHGIIMGIVYNKETIFVKFSNNIIGNDFKFQDFFKSINIIYKNIDVYNENILNNIIKVDYKYLLQIGKKIISLIPFINTNEKLLLEKKYIDFMQ